jgi:hypothetical protein
MFLAHSLLAIFVSVFDVPVPFSHLVDDFEVSDRRQIGIIQDRKGYDREFQVIIPAYPCAGRSG